MKKSVKTTKAPAVAPGLKLTHSQRYDMQECEHAALKDCPHNDEVLACLGALRLALSQERDRRVRAENELEYGKLDHAATKAKLVAAEEQAARTALPIEHALMAKILGVAPDTLKMPPGYHAVSPFGPLMTRMY